jgi:hypothetical protein
MLSKKGGERVRSKEMNMVTARLRFLPLRAGGYE